MVEEGQALRKDRNGEIEFLRFIFSCVIVLHHSRFLPGGGGIFARGSSAVEFFFILSGYLMMNSIQKMNTNSMVHQNTISQKSIQFIGKKIKAFYPELFIAWSIGLLVTVVCNVGANSYLMYKCFYGFFNDLLLLRMTGIMPWSGLNGVVWYASAMLLAMVILYPLILICPDMMRKMIIPTGSLLIIGFMIQNSLTVTTPNAWLGITYKGNLRAVAGLGLGVMSYNIAEIIRKYEYRKIIRIALTAFKVVAFLITIFWMQISRFNIEILCQILLVIAIAIVFSGKNADVKLFDKNICTLLGKISFPLYLSHVFYAENLGNVLPGTWTFFQMMLVYLFLSVTTAIIVLILSSWIKRKNMLLNITRYVIKH